MLCRVLSLVTRSIKAILTDTATSADACMRVPTVRLQSGKIRSMDESTVEYRSSRCR